MNEPLLCVKDVDRRFGGLHALKGVSFAVAPGSVTGIIGPNGSGKSTLFEIIAGAQRPTRGSIHFAGNDVTRLAAHQRCALGLGRTFQMVETLGSMTVLENVQVAALVRHKGETARLRAMELLERFGLTAKSDRAARELNASELRRLDVARALATEPSLLLLDEPLAGLTQDEMRRVFANLADFVKKGLTVIMVEHRLEAMFGFVSRVIALAAGEVIGTGTPQEIQRNERVIAAYLGPEAVSRAA
jgi:branched-chain amino acid transport system ATP-binding protein